MQRRTDVTTFLSSVAPASAPEIRGQERRQVQDTGADRASAQAGNAVSQMRERHSGRAAQRADTASRPAAGNHLEPPLSFLSAFPRLGEETRPSERLAQTALWSKRGEGHPGSSDVPCGLRGRGLRAAGETLGRLRRTHQRPPRPASFSDHFLSAQSSQNCGKIEEPGDLAPARACTEGPHAGERPLLPHPGSPMLPSAPHPAGESIGLRRGSASGLQVPGDRGPGVPSARRQRWT